MEEECVFLKSKRLNLGELRSGSVRSAFSQQARIKLD